MAEIRKTQNNFKDAIDSNVLLTRLTHNQVDPVLSLLLFPLICFSFTSNVSWIFVFKKTSRHKKCETVTLRFFQLKYSSTFESFLERFKSYQFNHFCHKNTRKIVLKLFNYSSWSRTTIIIIITKSFSKSHRRYISAETHRLTHTHACRLPVCFHSHILSLNHSDTQNTHAHIL